MLLARNVATASEHVLTKQTEAAKRIEKATE
jgi:hypothetical protein